VFEVPAGSRTSRGKPIVNIFPFEQGEKITAVVPVKEFDENHYVFMATSHGTVKKTSLAEFSRPRPSGIIAVGLDQGDYLVGCVLTDGSYDVMLFSSDGKAVRFQEGDVRPMGRQATGVRGMKLAKDQRVVCMLAAKDESRAVLTATANGYGKRTSVSEYPRHGRGGQGVIALQISERNGQMVGALLVKPDDEIMLISSSGTLVRTPVGEISIQGRNTQGVTLISLDQGEKLAGMERIEERDLGNGNGGNGDTHEEAPPPESPGPTVH
jgi:DNA gyrase subunit A